MGDNGVWIILGLVAVLALAGIPVVFSFALASALGLYLSLGAWGPTLDLLQQTAFHGVREYEFIVVPLFTVMGMLVARSGAAADLFRVVNRGLRGMPARLAVATIGGNALFAAVTGVGVAAAAAFSQIAYPYMRTVGYKRSFASGCITGSAVLGLLIPPSVFMIVWAILTEQSIGKLFAAGALPGLTLAGFYAIYCVATALIWPDTAPHGAAEDEASGRPNDPKARREETVGVIGVIGLILVVLGSIWGGVATPTEGSALGVLGSLILLFLKGGRFRDVTECFLRAGLTVVPILMLIIGANIYSRLLALEGVPDIIKFMLEDMGLTLAGTMLFMAATWFILGCLIDSISIMLLTVPIFYPIANSLGIDPMVFALVGILVIEAGVLTPPFGMGVFVVKSALPDPDIQLKEIFIGTVPYWFMILGLAYLIWLWPPLATWLPSVM